MGDFPHTDGDGDIFCQLQEGLIRYRFSADNRWVLSALIEAVFLSVFCPDSGFAAGRLDLAPLGSFDRDGAG
jgi:hypothetical protein